MNNAEISVAFREIASLLLEQKESWFKIRAYIKVADSIDKLDVSVERLVDEGRVVEVSGVGEAIAKKIDELVHTGKLEYLDKLKGKVSAL